MAPAADWRAACRWAGLCRAGGVWGSPAPASRRRNSGGEPSSSGPAGRFRAPASGQPRVRGPASDREGSPRCRASPRCKASSAQVCPSPLKAQMTWGGGPWTLWAQGPAMKIGLWEDREGRRPGRAGSPPVLGVTCCGSHIQGGDGKRWCFALLLPEKS